MIRHAAHLVVSASAIAVAAAPWAHAQPSLPHTGRDAAAVIADLQSQGYNVSINWLNGYDVSR